MGTAETEVEIDAVSFSGCGRNSKEALTEEPSEMSPRLSCKTCEDLKFWIAFNALRFLVSGNAPSDAEPVQDQDVPPRDNRYIDMQ